MISPANRRFQIILKQPFRIMLFSLGSRNIFVQPERHRVHARQQTVREVMGSGSLGGDQ